MTHPAMECPDCGTELTPEEEFVVRSDMISDAVEEIDDPFMELMLLAEAAGRFLADVPPEHRKWARRKLIAAMDEETKGYVIAACDA